MKGPFAGVYPRPRAGVSSPVDASIAKYGRGYTWTKAKEKAVRNPDSSLIYGNSV